MESQVEQDQEEGFAQFPDRVQEDVEGLIWLGYLEDAFDFCGHHFVIRTLRGEEELLAAAVTKEYVETLGQSRAWVWAVVSLSLVSVDGDEAFCPPIGPDRSAYARARFAYVTQNWFWPVAAAIFQRYTTLQERQTRAVEAVEDLSQGNLPMFTPFADSSTDKGDSPENLDMEEALDLLDEDPDSTS